MNFEGVQALAQKAGFTLIERVQHSTGAEIFIAEKYQNTDPEFPEPHWLTWYHVAFGEDKPLVGRKLFTRFGKQISRAARVRSAKRDANELISEVIGGYEREHG